VRKATPSPRFILSPLAVQDVEREMGLSFPAFLSRVIEQRTVSDLATLALCCLRGERPQVTIDDIFREYGLLDPASFFNGYTRLSEVVLAFVERDMPASPDEGRQLPRMEQHAKNARRPPVTGGLVSVTSPTVT
jgi:hypothetical protein